MKKKLIYIGVIFIAAANVNSQSSSYDQNSTPIYGSDNCGFGWQALNNTGLSPGNTATGYRALSNNYNGENNTANGAESLMKNASGNLNVGLGFQALYTNNAHNNVATGHSALRSNSSGSQNTAYGNEALYSNKSGHNNVASGVRALYSNNASDNTASGHNALYNNTSGTSNVGVGKNCLGSNYTGNSNSCIGFNAMYTPFLGMLSNMNVAAGSFALSLNSIGDWNVAVGHYALNGNYQGNENIAVGFRTLLDNTVASNNIAIGEGALRLNKSSWNNIALGTAALALHNVTSSIYRTGNVAIGYAALTANQTARNTGVGYYALITAIPNTGTPLYDGNSAFGALATVANSYSNATAIGYQAIVNNNDKIRLGDANVIAVESQVAIFCTSDGRFKNNVKEDVKGLEFIEKLRPLVYNFDTEKFTKYVSKNLPDSISKLYLSESFKKSTASRQSGFIAQEVEKAANEADFIFNGVTKPQHEDDHYGLSYDMFVVPLVKAIQEQQTLLDEQRKIIQALEKEVIERRHFLKNNQNNEINALEFIYTFQPGFDLRVMPDEKKQITTVFYTLPENMNEAVLNLYDLNGKQINQFFLDKTMRGSISLSSEVIKSGSYICSVIAGDIILGSSKMVIEN